MLIGKQLFKFSMMRNSIFLYTPSFFMTKTIKQILKKYPQELHPIAEEKMKCCAVVSAAWLKKINKWVKMPLSSFPSKFSQSINDLVGSDGKLFRNLKRGEDYELISCYLFENFLHFTDPDGKEKTPYIKCGLGHDPTTGEEMIAFDIAAFNIKMIKCGATKKWQLKSDETYGDRWYASKKWTVGEFLRQFCDVVDMNEEKYCFYKDSDLKSPIDPALTIATVAIYDFKKDLTNTLFFGPINRQNFSRSSSTSKLYLHSSSFMRSNSKRDKLTDDPHIPLPRIPPKHHDLSDAINEGSQSNAPKHYSQDTSDNSSKSHKKGHHSHKGELTIVRRSSETCTDVSDDDSELETSSHDHNVVPVKYKYSSSSVLMVPKIMPIGFRNNCNMCYMNAVLQCFIRIQQISALYYGSEYAAQINENNSVSSHGRISNALHDLIMSISASINPSTSQYHDLPKIYNPAQFQNVFVNQYNMFGSYEQQDAQEFLICLIDGLHEDINQAFPDDKSRKHALETLSPNETPWTVCRKLHKSLIYDIFLGMTETKILCSSCKSTDVVQEPFVVLCLPLPSSAFIHSARLETCLKLFCQHQSNANEKRHCEHCHRKTEAKKQLKIQQCGSVVIIVFKRFESESHDKKSISFKKNTVEINYPLILNLNPFSTKNVGKFKLIGVIQHTGTLNGGHYTSFALDQLQNCWFYFDDANVAQVDEKRIFTKDAYILFYQKA